MNRELRENMKNLKKRLYDFFFVYFDEKLARKMDNHPDLAIPTIKEAMLDKSYGFNKGRLTNYACALRDAVEYQRLRTTGGTGPR